MEIKAKCKFDTDSIRALTHLSIFKKANPKKTVIARFVLCFVLLLFVIAERNIYKFDSTPIILTVALMLMMLIDGFVYFILPKIQYRSLAKLKEAENEYVFFDDYIKVFSNSQEYKGEAKIEYSLFVKVFETSKYFFLYETKTQVFIVDKNTITDGSAEQIREKLSPILKSKYVICKY